MSLYERLIACGFSETAAEYFVDMFQFAELRDFVEFCERRQV